MVTNLDIQRKVCFLDCLTFEDATDRLSRNVCKLTTNLRCVTSQKNEDMNGIPLHVGRFTNHRKNAWKNGGKAGEKESHGRP